MTVRRGKLQFYRDAAGAWRWRIRARNGLVVADSAEGYSSKPKARQGYDAMLTAIGDVLAAQECAEVGG